MPSIAVLPAEPLLNSANVKTNLKSTALSTLRSGGVFSLAKRSRWRKQRLLILCYHGLSAHDEHEWSPHLYITPEHFRRRLACLRDMNATVLPLEEGLVRLSSGSLPETSVALTFDDGFVDFLDHGVPALEEFGFPCTLYLTTYYMRHRLPIVNLALDYILWKSKQEFVRLPEQGIEKEMATRSYAERQRIVRQILRRANERKLDTPQRDELARSVAERLRVNYQEILDRRMVQILRPEEATRVSKRGIDIQLHTHRHRTPMERDLFVREIQDNRRDIYEVTGKNPVHFCYPSGRYGLELLPWLKDCGVQSATTCERGLATRKTEPLLLPRVLDDSPTDLLRFQSFVSGLFA